MVWEQWARIIRAVKEHPVYMYFFNSILYDVLPAKLHTLQSLKKTHEGGAGHDNDELLLRNLSNVQGIYF